MCCPCARTVALLNNNPNKPVAILLVTVACDVPPSDICLACMETIRYRWCFASGRGFSPFCFRFRPCLISFDQHIDHWRWHNVWNSLFRWGRHPLGAFLGFCPIISFSKTGASFFMWRPPPSALLLPKSRISTHNGAYPNSNLYGHSYFFFNALVYTATCFALYHPHRGGM